MDVDGLMLLMFWENFHASVVFLNELPSDLKKDDNDGEQEDNKYPKEKPESNVKFPASPKIVGLVSTLLVISTLSVVGEAAEVG